MRDVMTAIQSDLERDAPAAYCRLVETRGSTPQKAGAVMLVYPNGQQVGTLGGGCVEAEVKRRALGIISEKKAVVEKFQLDHDYGWDDGLICGGRMQILIESLQTDRARQYYLQVAKRFLSGAPATEVVAFDNGSGLPFPVGLLFNEKEELVAVQDEAARERAGEIANLLKPIHDRPRPYVDKGLAFLPILQRCRLVIVGGGHVGQAVARLADDLDFHICVVDDRPEVVSEERFPLAQERISGPIEEVLADVEVNSDTYCLIVTRGHNHDEEALFHLINRGARYVGLIGSRRKIKLIFEDLLQECISPELIEQVHAPLGIHIGSQTVPEIAVSICAELIAHRNLGSRVPGRPEQITPLQAGGGRW